MAAKGYIEIDRELCKGCHLCMDVCPRSVLTASEELNSKGYRPPQFIENPPDGKGCTACTMCAIVCPDVAIEVYRAQ